MIHAAGPGRIVGDKAEVKGTDVEANAEVKAKAEKEWQRNAVDWLRESDRRIGLLLYDSATVEWEYNTNITEENKAATVGGSRPRPVEGLGARRTQLWDGST